MAAQAADLRAMREAAPPPLAPPPMLRRIAMICKQAPGDRAVRPEMQSYFVQIARVCREVVQRADSDREDYGT